MAEIKWLVNLRTTQTLFAESGAVIGVDPGGPEIVRVGGSVRATGGITSGGIVKSSSASEADIFLERTGTGARTVYLYNLGASFGFYDQVAGGSLWYYDGGASLASSRLHLNTPVQFDGMVGFFATSPIAKPAVSGSRASGAALVSLLSQLAALGLITNSTTA